MDKQLITMDDVLLDGKTVLVRVDFNVAVGDDGVVDKNEDYRIEAAVPTLEELVQKRCKVILLTHLGRPGQEDGNFEVDPIRRRLMELMNEDIKQLNALFGPGVRAVIDGMEAGSMAMLPNVRIDEREMTPNRGFAKELSEVAEVYINEAFSVCHRDQTSVSEIPKIMPACAGRRTVLEYEVLSKLAKEPKRPYVAIVSGSKVHTKVNLINNLLGLVDYLCVGGRIANTFLAAKGYCTEELCDADDMEVALSIMKQAGDKLVLPPDVVIESRPGEKMTVEVGNIPQQATGVWDIGSQTTKEYLRICEDAETVMWNGPVGKFEEESYAQGTNDLAAGLAEVKAKVVVGGGDTVLALEKLNLLKKFYHVSVGGGAMVALLEGSTMPGITPLLR